MRRLSFIVIIICLCITFSACAQNKKNADTYIVKVVGITDGDTFKGWTTSTYTHKDTLFKIRIFGIDAPEKNQAFGEKSKQYLSNLIYGKRVKIIGHGLDRYHRVLGTPYLMNNTNVSIEMLKAGMAWHFTRYDNNQQYDKYEQEARSKRVGLWIDPNPTPPWKFRYEERHQLSD